MLRVDELRETCRELMNEVAETDLVNADLQTKIRMLEVSNQRICLFWAAREMELGYQMLRRLIEID
jgi:hypothetical protein